MKKLAEFCRCRWWLAVALAPFLFSLQAGAAEARATNYCFQVQFILATDLMIDGYTAADNSIQARLKRVFRERKFYYEVNASSNRQPWCLGSGKAERRKIDGRFEIEVTSSAGPTLAISLYADGKLAKSVKQPVPRESLVFGWDDADRAWYVVFTPR